MVKELKELLDVNFFCKVIAVILLCIAMVNVRDSGHGDPDYYHDPYTNHTLYVFIVWVTQGYLLVAITYVIIYIIAVPKEDLEKLIVTAYLIITILALIVHIYYEIAYEPIENMERIGFLILTVIVLAVDFIFLGKAAA